MNAKINRFAVWGVALTMAAAVAGPVSAQTKRQQDKNNMRNLGVGLGAAAAHQLLRGNTTSALVLGAGAAYSGKKYEDARKAQRKESARRYHRTQGAAPIGVVLNDSRVQFSDAEPRMLQGRVYVPLRGVLEEMGADVRWDAQRRAAIATQGDKTVRLPVEGTATVNGRAVNLDDPAWLVNGRTYVPLRFLAEAFGADVKWNADERQVQIKSDS